MCVSKELCETTNNTEEREQHMTMKICNVNSLLWGQEFVPVAQYRRNDTDWPAGDLSHWWACQQDWRESGLKQTNGIEEPSWSATMKFLNTNDTYHRRKLAPTAFDCGHDPKSLLMLTHFALEATNDKRFWHFVIFSVSSFQPLLKFAPHQNQLQGLLSALKNNRDDNRPKSHLIQNVDQFILDS